MYKTISTNCSKERDNNNEKYNYISTCTIVYVVVPKNVTIIVSNKIISMHVQYYMYMHSYSKDRDKNYFVYNFKVLITVLQYFKAMSTSVIALTLLTARVFTILLSQRLQPEKQCGS